MPWVTTELDTEVRRMLFENISSYEQLETLLLLHNAPARPYSAIEVAAALRIDVENASASLGELAAHRLIAPQAGDASQCYRYAPADACLATSIDKLALAYASLRLEVVKQMSANAIVRLRSSVARTFADAFVLGGRKREDGGRR